MCDIQEISEDEKTTLKEIAKTFQALSNRNPLDDTHYLFPIYQKIQGLFHKNMDYILTSIASREMPDIVVPEALVVEACNFYSKIMKTGWKIVIDFILDKRIKALEVKLGQITNEKFKIKNVLSEIKEIEGKDKFLSDLKKLGIQLGSKTDEKTIKNVMLKIKKIKEIEKLRDLVDLDTLNKKVAKILNALLESNINRKIKRAKELEESLKDLGLNQEKIENILNVLPTSKEIKEIEGLKDLKKDPELINERIEKIKDVTRNIEKIQEIEKLIKDLNDLEKQLGPFAYEEIKWIQDVPKFKEISEIEDFLKTEIEIGSPKSQKSGLSSNNSPAGSNSTSPGGSNNNSPRKFGAPKTK
jgi:hypothetical protein